MFYIIQDNMIKLFIKKFAILIIIACASFIIGCGEKSSIELNGPDNIYVNEISRLEAVLVNIEGDVQWSSNDSGICTVDDEGNIQGISSGECIITGKIGKTSGEFTVNVLEDVIANVIIDYENELKEESDNKNTEKYIYFPLPISEVNYYIYFNSADSMSVFLENYDLKLMFPNATVGKNYIIMYFDRNDFKESVYRNLEKIIKDNESLIEKYKLYKYSDYSDIYMPKIDYYVTDYYAIDSQFISDIRDLTYKESVLLKSKEEYDMYLNDLLEYDNQSNMYYKIEDIVNLYDDAFFEENALIITDTIGNANYNPYYEIGNVYISNNKLYVVIKTFDPNVDLTMVSERLLIIKVKKDDIKNVKEVITLD